MRTAYEMAMTPSMSHRHFEILVKCQRENGVKLIKGRDNNRAGNHICVRPYLTRVVEIDWLL